MIYVLRVGIYNGVHRHLPVDWNGKMRLWFGTDHERLVQFESTGRVRWTDEGPIDVWVPVLTSGG